MENKIEEMIETGELEKVSGGYTFGEGALKGKPWEVIDDGDGRVVGRYETRQEAEEMAIEKHQSPKRIYWHGEGGLYELRR